MANGFDERQHEEHRDSNRRGARWDSAGGAARLSRSSMTSVTIARASCWITRGCRHTPPGGQRVQRQGTPMAPRPRYNPIVRESSVPSTM